jgi:predicted metal-dependent peptidase
MDVTKQIKKQNIAIMGNPTWMFMGGILCFGKWEVTDKVPTACTDGKNVYYGKEFCAVLSEPEIRFLILHEAFHKMAQHLRIYKQLHMLDARRANAACDYWINGEIIKQNDGSPFLKMIDGGLYNPKYYGMTVVQIFKDLEGKGNDDSGDGEGDGGDGQDTGKQDSRGNKITEGYPTGGDAMDEHDWSGGELSEEDRKSLEKDIEIAIRQGRQLAGKMSGNSPRIIDDLLAGRVDWRAELAEFIKDVMAGRDESSWSKMNRRLFHIGNFPGSISTTCGRLAVAPDMSGSIWGEPLARFMGEIKKLCQELKPSGVDILWWDTEVCGVQSFEPDQYDNLDQLMRPVGGGGTSPQCVADWLVLNKTNNYECVVLLSDGYVDSFPVFEIPALWAMTTDIVAPSGRTIKLDEV